MKQVLPILRNPTRPDFSRLTGAGAGAAVTMRLLRYDEEPLNFGELRCESDESESETELRDGGAGAAAATDDVERLFDPSRPLDARRRDPFVLRSAEEDPLLLAT